MVHSKRRTVSVLKSDTCPDLTNSKVFARLLGSLQYRHTRDLYTSRRCVRQENLHLLVSSPLVHWESLKGDQPPHSQRPFYPLFLGQILTKEVSNE